MLPQYFADKVNLFVALAPVVRLDHSPNRALVWLSQFESYIVWIIRFFNWYNILDLPPAMRFLASEFCVTLPTVCVYLDEKVDLFSFGNSIENLDRLGEHYMYDPAGSGWKQHSHFGQIINSKKFQRYDYGTDGNNVIYK